MRSSLVVLNPPFAAPLLLLPVPAPPQPEQGALSPYISLPFTQANVSLFSISGGVRLQSKLAVGDEKEFSAADS